MDNDRRKIELMNSILMSMPGTPIIYYGDEIGMGDNIYLGDRNGVRTPMQWTPDRNGGFSRCDPAQLFLPCIMDPVYGFSAVNVEAQARSLSSLLNWTKRLIGVRKSSNVFGRGTLAFIRPANRAVLAYVRQLGDEAILCVANISRSAQAVELDMTPVEGPRPAGNARAHALSAHRRTALSGHAAALRLLLVLAAARRGQRAGEGPAARDHHPGAWTGMGLAADRLDAAHVRARRPAGLLAGPPLVRRQGVALHHDEGLGRPAGRARRRPFRHRYRRRDRQSRHQPLFPAADHPLDALHGNRPRPGQRARRRAPRPARRHAARRHHRAGIHHRAAGEDPRRRDGRAITRNASNSARPALSPARRCRRSRPSTRSSASSPTPA